MKTGNTKILVVVGLVGLAAAGALYLLRESKGRQASPPPATKTSQVGAQKRTNAVPSTVSATGHAARAAQPLARRSPVSPTNEIVVLEDREEAEKLQDRLDSDDQAAVLVLARKLMLSKDVEVRSQVVGALGWIGIKALPELSALLSDESEEIVAEAFQRWKEAVDEVSDEAMKGQLLVAGMQALKGQDDLEACAMEFNSLPDDIAVRGLLTVIQSSNPIASEVARGHYAFVTGNAYTTPADAEKWITENVEPPAVGQPVPK